LRHFCFHPLSKSKRLTPGVNCSQTLHHLSQYFLQVSGDCIRYPNQDADMSRPLVAATAVLVALATIMLSACGPDDSASASVDQSSTTADAAPSSGPPSARETTPTVTPSAPFAASATLTGAPAASEPAVQSVQSSLAADSQQVAPVMHYAPGDSGQGGQSGTNN
jgi:hypothetical protein